MSYDDYIAEIVQAVRPNWAYFVNNHSHLSCIVNLKVELTGKVTEAKLIESSV
ncbi:MAG: TonB C-terminal domain-containing protein [Desulfovibrio sp.]|nr:TonB C-terminal domain-containing protein [Desulfovibrio sp.]